MEPIDDFAALFSGQAGRRYELVGELEHLVETEIRDAGGDTVAVARVRWLLRPVQAAAR